MSGGELNIPNPELGKSPEAALTIESQFCDSNFSIRKIDTPDGVVNVFCPNWIPETFTPTHYEPTFKFPKSLQTFQYKGRTNAKGTFYATRFSVCTREKLFSLPFSFFRTNNIVKLSCLNAVGFSGIFRISVCPANVGIPDVRGPAIFWKPEICPVIYVLLPYNHPQYMHSTGLLTEVNSLTVANSYFPYLIIKAEANNLNVNVPYINIYASNYDTQYFGLTHIPAIAFEGDDNALALVPDPNVKITAIAFSKSNICNITCHNIESDEVVTVPSGTVQTTKKDIIFAVKTQTGALGYLHIDYDNNGWFMQNDDKKGYVIKGISSTDTFYIQKGLDPKTFTNITTEDQFKALVNKPDSFFCYSSEVKINTDQIAVPSYTFKPVDNTRGWKWNLFSAVVGTFFGPFNGLVSAVLDFTYYTILGFTREELRIMTHEQISPQAASQRFRKDFTYAFVPISAGMKVELDETSATIVHPQYGATPLLTGKPEEPVLVNPNIGQEIPLLIYPSPSRKMTLYHSVDRISERSEDLASYMGYFKPGEDWLLFSDDIGNATKHRAVNLATNPWSTTNSIYWACGNDTGGGVLRITEDRESINYVLMLSYVENEFLYNSYLPTWVKIDKLKDFFPGKKEKHPMTAATDIFSIPFTIKNSDIKLYFAAKDYNTTPVDYPLCPMLFKTDVQEETNITRCFLANHFFFGVESLSSKCPEPYPSVTFDKVLPSSRFDKLDLRQNCKNCILNNIDTETQVNKPLYSQYLIDTPKACNILAWDLPSQYSLTDIKVVRTTIWKYRTSINYLLNLINIKDFVCPDLVIPPIKTSFEIRFRDIMMNENYNDISKFSLDELLEVYVVVFTKLFYSEILFNQLNVSYAIDKFNTPCNEWIKTKSQLSPKQILLTKKLRQNMNTDASTAQTGETTPSSSTGMRSEPSGGSNIMAATMGQSAQYSVAADSQWTPLMKLVLDAKTSTKKPIIIIPLHPRAFKTDNGKVSHIQVEAFRHAYFGVPSGDACPYEFRVTSSANAFCNGRVLISHIPFISEGIYDTLSNLTPEQLTQYPCTEHELHGRETMFPVRWAHPLPALPTAANIPFGHLVVSLLEYVNTGDDTNTNAQLQIFIRAHSARYTFPIQFDVLPILKPEET